MTCLELEKYISLLVELKPIYGKPIYTLNLCYHQNYIIKELKVVIIDKSDNEKYITVQALYGEQFTLMKNNNYYYSLLVNPLNEHELDRLGNKFINIDTKSMIPRPANIHDINEIMSCIETVQFSYFNSDFI